MPRPPRPKPATTASPTGSASQDALPAYMGSWKRREHRVELNTAFDFLVCELCRQVVLVPAIRSRRVLSAYLHDHRVDCHAYQETDGSKAEDHSSDENGTA